MRREPYLLKTSREDETSVESLVTRLLNIGLEVDRRITGTTRNCWDDCGKVQGKCHHYGKYRRKEVDC